MKAMRVYLDENILIFLPSHKNYFEKDRWQICVFVSHFCQIHVQYIQIFIYLFTVHLVSFIKKNEEKFQHP